ncbi:2OG-Fe dioxygenase family protein [Bradyrhizobium diazoefficiens]|nr:2OG-Fe dioxygenase family protein [Bradyrhizobium diazoefficiens]
MATIAVARLARICREPERPWRRSTHMSDGGRYRRRRYTVFEVTKGSINRQPHYQAKVYNRLNGGLERWFEPVLPEIGQHPIVRTLIGAWRRHLRGSYVGPRHRASVACRTASIPH